MSAGLALIGAGLPTPPPGRPKVSRSGGPDLSLGDAAGVGQVDVPLGIRHDRVSLHHGAVARAAGIEAIAPVGDDPVALAADGPAAGPRGVAADGHPPGLDEPHAIARVAADRVILDLRAG